MRAYNPTINILRVISVSSVLLYHIDSSRFQNGFLGVDIFLIISGFLMADIMERYGRLNYTTYIKFFLARLRRLLPPLIVTSALSLIACMLLMMPADLEDASEAIFSSLLFVSNVYFLLTTNYFNNYSASGVYLHTWSLSLELQYYMCAPFLIHFLNKLKLINVIWLLLVATFLAIVLSGIKDMYQFFLLPGRIYQFWAGYFVFRLINETGLVTLKKRRLSFVFKETGLFVVICLVLLLDGFFVAGIYVNILITLLTVSLLFVSYGSTLSARLDAIWVLRLVGMYSYSIYLVHQPIIFLLSYSEVL